MQNITIREPVYIIIPVYNRKAITLKCLETLSHNGDLHRYHIVVVDDSSTDGTSAAINTLYPDVTVLTGDGNLWWTGAIAMGMKYARERGAEYFFWLNDDCLPAPDTLPGLVDFMQSHPNILVAPTAYASEFSPQNRQSNGAYGRGKPQVYDDGVLSVDSMSGWCVGIPSAVCDRIGVPDAKKFPHYAGDDIYVLQAIRSGFQACIVEKFHVILVGAVRDTSGFHKYFQPGRKPMEVMEALFWHKKSPYRLETRYFALCERYGLLLGIVLFTTKLILWFAKYLQLQIIVWLKPNAWRAGENI
jgi:GT2 family glycosyltransferase